VHRCYQGGFAQSAVLAASLTVHRLAGTYRHLVRTYIALTNAARDEFVSAGLPAARIVVKPNFVAQPQPQCERLRANVLYVGRLSPEKGISTLAAVATKMPQVRFLVAGSGPSESLLSSLPNVTLLGQLAPAAVLEEMRTAKCLLMPSHCPEGMPMTLLEAFSCGLPVVASDIGSLAELVEPGLAGLLFPVGDSTACAEQISTLLTDQPLWDRINDEIKTRAIEQFGPGQNLKMLETIYSACRTPERSPL
jgi:glycosyltransferase involved in cell wall biosynthesis